MYINIFHGRDQNNHFRKHMFPKKKQKKKKYSIEKIVEYIYVRILNMYISIYFDGQRDNRDQKKQKNHFKKTTTTHLSKRIPAPTCAITPIPSFSKIFVFPRTTTSEKRKKKKIKKKNIFIFNFSNKKSQSILYNKMIYLTSINTFIVKFKRNEIFYLKKQIFSY